MGMIVPWPLNFAPRNWAFCDGALLDIRNYTALFSIIGTTYGGDGKTNFALPNLLGQLAPGADAITEAGEEVGLTSATFPSTASVTVANLPPHVHPVTATLTSVTGETTVLIGTASAGGQRVPTNNAQLTGTADGPPAGAAIYLPASITPPATVDLGGVSTAPGSVSGPGLVNTNTTVHAAVALTSTTTTAVTAANSLTLNYIICTVGEFPMRN
jgi:microcystin-dependent protein